MQFAVYGLIMGCILLLATVGFSMIRRIEGFLNIAHGQMLAVGGYSCYVFNNLLGWNIIPSAIAAVLVTSVFGYLVAYVVFFPLKGKPPLLIAIASTGASYIIQGLIEVIFGPFVKQYQVPADAHDQDRRLVVGGSRSDRHGHRRGSGGTFLALSPDPHRDRQGDPGDGEQFRSGAHSRDQYPAPACLCLADRLRPGRAGRGHDRLGQQTGSIYGF